jgi:RND family efflux transporter MFP subunit
MKTTRSVAAAVGIAVILVAALTWALQSSSRAADTDAPTAPRPALTVTATTPQPTMLPVSVSANGNVMAWQEASIGTEADGLRLAAVAVNVGDSVRRGQVLAVFASDTVVAELAQSEAAAAEVEAQLAEAEDNARRALELQKTGALSAQQIRQYVTAERTARARLEAMRAAERTQRLRLAQTRVLAPDDGVISARSATVGAVLPAGQELFRLIRRGRLEWRAEVAAPELAKLQPGQRVRVVPVGGEPVEGTLRMVSPVIDPQTRNGLVYVDLPAGAAARAGMFARGEIQIGTHQMTTLPQSAVLLRDGHAYVMRIDSDDKVIQTKVMAGRRVGDRIEITGGLDASARVVASGVAFLGDGDLVRVTDAPSSPQGGRSAAQSLVMAN